jgi:hypothetical protein
MTLHQGSQRLTLANYGSAHTDGDTVIYIAPANVVVVGDIFSNHFYPIIDLASGGSIGGMIRSLDQILAQTDEQTKIVAGHGPVATRADLLDYRDMLVQVRQRIQSLIAAGKTMDEAVAATPTKDFDGKWSVATPREPGAPSGPELLGKPVQELPINTPVPKTKAPPTATCVAADRIGVSM